MIYIIYLAGGIQVLFNARTWCWTRFLGPTIKNETYRYIEQEHVCM